jgi:hypothetical protein
MAFAFSSMHNPENEWEQKTIDYNNLRNKQMYAKRSSVAQELGSRTNGRIDILNSTPEPRYQLYDGTKHIDNNYTPEAIKGIHMDTQISQSFFSQQNIDEIQNMLRYNIWILSEKQYLIDRQSDSELRLIMRSMYLQYCQHQQNNIQAQINYLNKLVVDYCLPKILSEIKQYKKYRQDASGLYRPIDRSVNMSVKGSKSLELKNFF